MNGHLCTDTVLIDSTTQKGTAHASHDAKRDFETEVHYQRIHELTLHYGLWRLAGVELPWEDLGPASPEEALNRLRRLLPT